MIKVIEIYKNDNFIFSVNEKDYKVEIKNGCIKLERKDILTYADAEVIGFNQMLVKNGYWHVIAEVWEGK